MLILKGRLVGMEMQKEDKEKNRKACQKLQVLSTKGFKPELFEVKDYEMIKAEVGKDIEISVGVRSYYFNGSHGLTFSHFAAR